MGAFIIIAGLPLDKAWSDLILLGDTNLDAKPFKNSYIPRKAFVACDEEL